jgi:uncharacterized protein YndB with AHSA1/START domain
LRLAKLEGDAAFTYVLTPAIDASSLMDTVERTYFAFRRRLRDVGRASTCSCNACTRMPNLDLKLVAHHGTVVRQRVAGRDELVGSDVILAHRLLKNEVTTRTGVAAYALYTDACLRAAGVIDPASLSLIEHRETYEHIGEVVGWVTDLWAAWTAEQERSPVVIEPAATVVSREFDLPAPPAVAWEFITSPAARPQWQAGVSAVIEKTAGGRRGIGTTNHCVHGKDATVEEILDWRPPEYLTLRWQMPIPNAPKIKMMEALEPTPGGSHVTMRMERPRSAKDRAFLESVLPMLGPVFEAGMAALVPLLEAEMARRAQDAAANPEPAVPASAGRFLQPGVDPRVARSS